MQTWIEDVATYLKKADPNHLVTIGGEGFYGPTSKKGAAVNPGNGWASITGQDFENNYRVKAVDFAVAHVWSDNWEVSSSAGPEWNVLVQAACQAQRCPSS